MLAGQKAHLQGQPTAIGDPSAPHFENPPLFLDFSMNSNPALGGGPRLHVWFLCCHVEGPHWCTPAARTQAFWLHFHGPVRSLPPVLLMRDGGGGGGGGGNGGNGLVEA